MFFTLHYGVAVWCMFWTDLMHFLECSSGYRRRGRPEAGCGGDVFVCCRAAAVQWARTAKGAAAEWPQELLWQLHLPECSQEVQSLSGHFDQCCGASCPCRVLWDACALSPFMYSGRCLFLRLIMVPFVSWRKQSGYFPCTTGPADSVGWLVNPLRHLCALLFNVHNGTVNTNRLI